MEEGTTRFDEMKRDGRLRWVPDERAWVARPDDIVEALAHEGYAEYKREVARDGRSARGGVWQGIDPRTGAVASAIWVNRPAELGTLVFIDIDGQPLMERT
jgi:hypothetical protein